jgi:2,4-dienoyl-CoA reductase-like NADH-dependent reductase (Old Yellow Enzyme family)/thioredoxin reductase
MVQKKDKFERMFEPAFLGALKVKNRLIMAPMGSRLANEIGGISKRQIDYYAERAKGGVGTIIVEVTGVDSPGGVASPNTLTIHEDFYIGGHNELVEAVHVYGAKVMPQLGHMGRNRRFAMGVQPVAPSAIPNKFFNVVPRELAISEIEEIEKKFVAAAVRAKTAGYDGVELHGAHGYLIAEFMSAKSNQRKDRYGGSLENRMAFPVNIVQGIRQGTGPKFPILFRFSADEFEEGGLGLEESKRVAQFLEDAGVDVLDVSAGTYDSMPTTIEPMSYPEGWKIYLAEAIKKVVKIPVIGVGVIRTPEFAEELLRDEKVDFVALARALLADPYWPLKSREGREEEIIPCISCNSCIGHRTFRGLHIRCAVNPWAGREQFKENLAVAGKRKKIFIVGGGSSGIMAALIAKKRGHFVKIYEKSNELGGQLRLAAAPPGKEKLLWFRDYLRQEIKRQKIEVRLGRPAAPEEIIRGNPDMVILATGAQPLIPDIPGTKNKIVCTAWDVLEGKRKIKDKVVLVIGGGVVGCETALYLAPQNNKIVILEMLKDLALDMDFINRIDLMAKIQESSIEALMGKKVERIEPDGVIVKDQEKKEEKIKGDIVVLALGVTPVDDLANQLQGKVREIHIVGDCHQPRKIIDAVYEGFQAGLR